MKASVWVAVVLAVCGSASPGQNIGTWRNFTSMKSVTAVADGGTTLWATSRGGLFGWQAGADAFSLFTSAEGLQSIDLTTVGIDPGGRVWAGSTPGYIHVLNPTTGSVQIIRDIAASSRANKKIQSFRMVGDTVLICSDLGLSVFRISRFEFGDTYSRFGSIPPSITVAALSALIHDDSLRVAISDGATLNYVAVASTRLPNLLPPESWTLQQTGPPGVIPGSLEVFGGTLYCGTSAGLYMYSAGVWSPVPGFPAVTVTGLAASDSLLVASSGARQVYQVSASGSVTQLGPDLPSTATSVSLLGTSTPVAGTVDAGAQRLEGASWTTVLPEGPNSSQVPSVVVDPAGTVWTASGTINGAGISRYAGGRWTSFTPRNSPVPTFDYYRMSVDCNGSVWGSSWGRGVAEFRGGADTVSPSDIYGSNVGMVGLAGDLSFIVVSNVACDSKGNRWMSILLAADRRILVVQRNDDTWQTLPVLLGTSRISALTEGYVDQTLVVDAFDNLWSVVTDGSFRGVISFGNRGEIDSTVAFHLTTASGLPSDEVRTIIVDRENDLWIGTSRGIAIVLDPSNPTRPGGIAAYKPLNGQTINTIAIDPLNRKWVGTNEGVVLLSADGTQVLESYTVENTNGRIIDNEIRSIAVEARTGTVYIASPSGLASLTTAAAAPSASFNGFKVSPNPFVIPGAAPLTVDGLIENARLRILSVDGRTVRDLETPGGRIGFWDGKDDAGNDVASGIYLIVGYSADGQEVGTGKVAVVRR